jgi:ArsR family transcriptional regulator
VGGESILDTQSSPACGLTSLAFIHTCGYLHVCMPAPTRVDLTPVSALFRALGDETRLRIVALLSHGELCVCHVQEALGLAQPAASRHLGILKNAGVISSRKEGVWTYHRLAAQQDPQRKRQLQALAKAFGAEEKLGRDVERLLRSKGPRACK